MPSRPTASAICRGAAAAVLAGAVGGCRHAAAPCAPTHGEAVAVAVRDARTGAALVGARGTVAEGAFLDSLRVREFANPVGNILTGGGGRAGTYAVTVERASYRTWRRDGVRVRPGACGVVTATLVADLEPAP